MTDEKWFLTPFPCSLPVASSYAVVETRTRRRGCRSRPERQPGRSYTDSSRRSLRAVERRVRETHRGPCGWCVSRTLRAIRHCPSVIAYLAITGIVSPDLPPDLRACRTPLLQSKTPDPFFPLVPLAGRSRVPQCWPFCHWVAIVVDHFSRRTMGISAFKGQPNFLKRVGLLGAPSPKPERRQVHRLRSRQTVRLRWLPRSVPTERYQAPRYGAIGKHGSIAVVERVILTDKMPPLAITARAYIDAKHSCAS